MATLENIIGVQEPVKATIWYALNNYFHEDAIFLAERLHAEVSSLDSAYLLATCYYRSGRVQQAKYLLSRARDWTTNANTAQCNLLYARCCLDLKEYKSGLLALNGLLCVHDHYSETELAAQYGSDAGLAFWLLGELNSRLNQTNEAARFFKAALKYNPFLWTAYQSLCEMGEFVEPKDYFKVSKYPSFLQSSVLSAPFTTAQPPVFSHSAATLTAEPCPSQPVQPTQTTATDRGTTGDTEVDLICTEQSEMDIGTSVVDGASSLMGGVSSAFTPVESKGVVTPSLYGNPAVGKAVASSTPAAARSLTFSTSNGPTAAPQSTLYGGPGDKGLPGSIPVFRDIRAALFLSNGSSTQSSQPSGHVIRQRGHMTGRPLPPAVTPLAPSFGVLTFDTPVEPGSSTYLLHSPSKLLDFSRLTPSPTSSPVATNKLSFTPAPVNHPLTVSASADRVQTVPSLSTNQSSEGMSHDEAATPPGVATPSLFKVPSAPKSEAPLRRSTRLKNTTKAGLSEHVIHSTRTVGKSRLRSPTSNRKAMTEATKKGQKVSFSTPVNAHSSFSSHAGGNSTPTPSIITSSLPPSTSTLSTPSGREDGVKEQSLSVRESAGDSNGGSETRELQCSHLQLLLEKQLSQQKQAAMTGLVSLMSLLEQIGSAYQSLCTYDLGMAVRLFQSLPTHQRETTWVKGHMARAYFAGERFKKCAQLYREVHHMEPHRQEGMELYASSLWHLQKDVELSVVAESLHSSNKLSPEALCAMASVMNLNRNHESARKFLSRAIQVAPQFSYAHTLLGHEYWITKDFDKALSSFQDAVTINPRHYNAWYGMAHVYYAQEKYRFAETYASRALSINKCSSIACTQLALAQFRLGELRRALYTLGQAISINSSNPIPRFHRAKVLEAFGKPEEALAQLDILTTQWPTEPELYISKGKILKSLNRGDEAVLQFSWALDFSRNVPSSHIREQIDQVYHEHTAHRVDHFDDSDFVPYPDPDGGELLDDSVRSLEEQHQEEEEGGSGDESMNS